MVRVNWKRKKVNHPPLFSKTMVQSMVVFAALYLSLLLGLFVSPILSNVIAANLN